jgi:hypothetical protein
MYESPASEEKPFVLVEVASFPVVDYFRDIQQGVNTVV